MVEDAITARVKVRVDDATEDKEAIAAVEDAVAARVEARVEDAAKAEGATTMVEDAADATCKEATIGCPKFTRCYGYCYGGQASITYLQ